MRNTLAADAKAEFELLASVAKANADIGKVAQVILDHMATHGRLPADELRTLGERLCDLGSLLLSAAVSVERPVIEG